MHGRAPSRGMAQKIRKEEAQASGADETSFALGAVQTTFLVVGTQGPKGPHYMVANWGTQASFEPWRYVLALEEDSHTRKYVQERGAFTINLVDAAHKDLVKTILKTKGWDGHAGEEGPVEAPRLPEAFTGFDCKLLDAVDIGGDHVLAVAEIVGGWKKGEGPALTLADMRMSYSG